MTEAPTVPSPITAGSAPTGAVPGQDDPFLRLHKMSITAGLGSGDYVAISGLAIAAVLLGVLSLLVLFHIALLLLVPAAGLTCAVLAWLQVGRSNGTLTGRGLAVLGGVLALGLGGFEAAQQSTALLTDRSDQSTVVRLIRGFGSDVVQSRFQQAYAECDDTFRQAVPEAAFQGTWEAIRHSSRFGNMTGVDWNGRLIFEVDPVSGRRIASGMVLIQFDRTSEPVRTGMFFRQDDQGWLIDRMPEMFAASGQGPKPKGAKVGPIGPPKPATP